MDSQSSNFENIRQKIARHPLDLQYRLDFGAALLDRVDFDGAISELLRALNSPFPRLRWPSLKLLAAAYEAKGMVEEAALMRERLSREAIE